MLSVRAGQIFFLAAALVVTPSFASRVHRAATSGHTKSSTTHKGKRSKSKAVLGQRAIDSDRATQIQNALIQQKYLTGSPSGHWDAETETAMQKYQADHGWQTKLMPDSRALISLGLGPEPASSVQVATKPADGGSALSGEPATPQPNTLASIHSISQ